MIKYYLFSDGDGIVSDGASIKIVKINTLCVETAFNESPDGTIYINQRQYPLKSGFAQIPDAAFRQGDNDMAIMIDGDNCVCVEKLRRVGIMLTPAGCGERRAAQNGLLIDRLSRKVEELEGRLKKLEDNFGIRIFK